MKKIVLYACIFILRNVCAVISQEEFIGYIQNSKTGIGVDVMAVADALKEDASLAQTKVDFDTGETVLMLAVRKQFPFMVKTLLKHDANIDAKKKDGETALLMAVKEDNPEIVKILLDNKASIDGKIGYGKYLDIFAEALKIGNEAVIKEFLNNKNGVAINAVRGTRTPLMIAIERDNVAVVQLLLNEGADPKIGAPGAFGGISTMEVVGWGEKKPNNAKIAALIKKALGIHDEEPQGNAIFHLAESLHELHSKK